MPLLAAHLLKTRAKSAKTGPKVHAITSAWRATLLCLIFFAGTILPQTSHAYSNQLVNLLEDNDLSGAYHWLVQNEAFYADDPAFNEWLAHLAMLLGQYSHAINALERIVLLQPEHLGAQLDLAQAYYKIGDRRQARQHLTQLNQTLSRIDNIPPRVKTALSDLTKKLQPSANQYQWKGLAQMGSGYDSNVNLGAKEATVNLNIQGEFPFQLELAPQSIATDDRFELQRLQVAVEAPKNTCYRQSWCSTLIADLSTRAYHNQTKYDQQQLLLGGILSQHQPQQVSQWLSYIHYANLNEFDSEAALAIEYNQRIQKNKDWLGYALNLNYRHKNSTTQSATQQLSATLFANTPNKGRYSGGLAYHNRPGHPSGNTWQARLTASYSHAIAASLTQHSASIIWERDSQPYSRLLFGDKARQDIQLQLTSSITWRLTAHWATTLKAGYSLNNSSIPMFERNRLEGTATLSYRW